MLRGSSKKYSISTGFSRGSGREKLSKSSSRCKNRRKAIDIVKGRFLAAFTCGYSSQRQTFERPEQLKDFIASSSDMVKYDFINVMSNCFNSSAESLSTLLNLTEALKLQCE